MKTANIKLKNVSIDMRDLFTRNKKDLLPLGGILLIIMLSILVLVPQIKKVLSIRKKLVVQQKEISLLSQKVADLQTLSEAEL
jgi:type II secretory pathway component PulM